MNHPKLTISKFVGRKLAVILLIAVSAAASFATLGDGKKVKSALTQLLPIKKAIPLILFHLKRK